MVKEILDKYFKFIEKEYRRYKYKIGPFPSALACVPNEPDVLKVKNVINMYNGTRCQYTEKIKGIPVTIWFTKNFFNKRILHVATNDKELFGDNDIIRSETLNILSEKLDIKKLPSDLVLQGELISAVLGNEYRIRESHIYFFQVIDKYKKFIEPGAARKILTDAGLECVPLLGEFKLSTSIEYLEDLSNGESALADTLREGIVVRPIHNIYIWESNNFVDNRFSFKVISPRYISAHKGKSIKRES
jgi:hypothetical protein